MAKLPLEGIRVIEIGVVWAGPYAAWLLACLGAEVIRVESIQFFPTVTRGFMPVPPKPLLDAGAGGSILDRNPGERAWDKTAFFNRVAWNKLSCCIDLTRPEGVEVFKKLYKVSNVLVENNAAATMGKLGIDYEAMKDVNPRMVYIQMPSYGMTGPYSSYMGFGDNAEALSGGHWLRGTPGPGWPMSNTDTYYIDAPGGACAAFAALLGLWHRDKTGKGVYFDVAQVETVFPQMAEAIMDYAWNGRIHQTIGNRHPSAAPCGMYRCRTPLTQYTYENYVTQPNLPRLGEEDWVAITVTSDEEWERFCRAMGNPPWTREERFSDCLSRHKNQDELDRLIEDWTLRHDHYEVMYILQKEGVAAGPVTNPKECFQDPQLVTRRFFEVISHSATGTHLYPGFQWKYSETPMSVRTPPCCLGEHNEYVFKHVIGLSDEEIAQLEKEQIIGGDTYLDLSLTGGRKM